jgi:archaemetzincin
MNGMGQPYVRTARASTRGGNFLSAALSSASMKLARRSLLLGAGSALLGCADGRSKPEVPLAKSGLAAQAKRRYAEALPPYAPRHLREVRDRLAPLMERTGAPRPGEWRYDHPETGQSFEEYLRSQPTAPTGARRTLVVQPLGELGGGSTRIVGLVASYLEAHFGLPVRLAERAPLPSPPRGARRNTERGEQLLTRWLLDDVLRPRVTEDASTVLGFLATDLWPGAGWNYVFGEASLTERVGVWSLARFGDPDAGPVAFQSALGRALKTGVHEAGHAFSLPHCTRYRCVQAGVNSLEESDAAPLWACAECLPKIAWVTSTDPRERLERTRDFCARHRFSDEAAFFERARAAILG